MTDIGNPEQLKAAVNAILKECLEEISNEVLDYMKTYLQENWYNAYFPTAYDRTYQLLESIVKTEIKTTGNRMYVSVRFDIDKITPMEVLGDTWNSHQDVWGEEDFTKGLVETVEMGNDSPLFSRPGIGILEQTSEWLDTKLPGIVTKIFNKYQIKVSF